MAEATHKPRAAPIYFFVVRGAVALGLGVAVLISGSGLSRLATFVAVYWIAAAVVTLRWVTSQPGLRGRRLGLGAGAIGLAAGIAVVFRRPLDGLLGEGVLLDLLGMSAIATGVLRMSGRFHDDQISGERPRLRYRIVVGVLDVLLGVSLIIADESSSDDVRTALAAWGLMTGTLLVLDALELRRRARARLTRTAR